MSVYILGSNFNRIKIGISADPVARAAQIRATSPVKIELSVRFTRQLSPVDARQGESALHKHFSPYRLHGEWFSVSVSEAIEAAETLLAHYKIAPDPVHGDIPTTVRMTGGITLPRLASAQRNLISKAMGSSR